MNTSKFGLSNQICLENQKEYNMEDTERKLATIDTILDLQPIEGADRIEVAKIRGWNVVVKKGEFSIGDKCVYFEVDSVLPADDERYNFLKNAFNSRLNGYRIKTVRMRGQISQGLALPITEFPELEYRVKEGTLNVGDDVTELLNVRIYTEPISNVMGAKSKSTFPSELIQKTDAERYQNIDFNNWYQNVINADSHGHTLTFISTEKLDGTSFVVFQDPDGNVRMCSRNRELQIEDGESVYHYIFNKYKFREIFEDQNYVFPFAIYGEIIGPSIQKNVYGLSDYEFHVFNMFDIENQVYFSWRSVEDIADMYGLNTVKQYLPPMTALQIYDSFHGKTDNEIQNKMFRGFERKNPVEGWVFRPLFAFTREYRDKLMFKVINNDYLLKHEG